MPRGNRMRSLISGPMGQGPMIGRGAGFGAGYRRENGWGQGFGGGELGFQQRLRGSIPTESTTESEKAFLQNCVEILARELEDAKARLAELNATKES